MTRQYVRIWPYCNYLSFHMQCPYYLGRVLKPPSFSKTSQIWLLVWFLTSCGDWEIVRHGSFSIWSMSVWEIIRPIHSQHHLPVHPVGQERKILGRETERVNRYATDSFSGGISL